MPDPDFTTLDYPNPEDPKAFTLALKLAKEKNADIVLATDPDADRLGIYALDTKSGEYVPFTGNMYPERADGYRQDALESVSRDQHRDHKYGPCHCR